MSTTLLGVFVGSVLGAAALAVYSVAILLEGRRRPSLNTFAPVERPTRPLPAPPQQVVRSLPGLPPAPLPRVTWASQNEPRFALGSVAEPLRRVPRASSPPQFRRAVFIDQEFADEAPTEQLARPFIAGSTRRPVRGRA